MRAPSAPETIRDTAWSCTLPGGTASACAAGVAAPALADRCRGLAPPLCKETLCRHMPERAGTPVVTAQPLPCRPDPGSPWPTCAQGFGRMQACAAPGCKRRSERAAAAHASVTRGTQRPPFWRQGPREGHKRQGPRGRALEAGRGALPAARPSARGARAPEREHGGVQVTREQPQEGQPQRHVASVLLQEQHRRAAAPLRRAGQRARVQVPGVQLRAVLRGEPDILPGRGLVGGTLGAGTGPGP